MEFQPRDLITIIGGAVSLTGLYYALKRDVVKVSASLKTVESYHKREVTMLAESIKDTKEEFNDKLNIMKEEQNKAIDKLEKNIKLLEEVTGERFSKKCKTFFYKSIFLNRHKS